MEIGDLQVLSPTTFEASAGELWSVTGVNGAGKTTLLRVLSGRLETATGTCLIHGDPVDLARPEQRRRVATLVDPVPVARDLTVREHVTMVAASWTGRESSALTQAEEALELLDLTPRGDHFPHELSSGQSQMFLLALVLVRPADVLLLDEPERHLDDDRVVRLAAALRRRAEAGSTVIAATHDVRLVEASHRRLALS